MSTLVSDLVAVAPLAIVVCAALIVLLVESLRHETELLNFWIAAVGLLASLVVGLLTLDNRGTAFYGMLTVGGYASFFAIVFSLSGLLSVLLSQRYIRKEGIEHGEYYVLILFAVAGMMTMGAAADLVSFFLGLEIMSVCFYVLAGFARRRLSSNEAALKYFLLGAFATGFLLYGIALLYGSTGSTSIAALAGSARAQAGNPIFVIGAALLLIGLLFKVAVVPFHMWVPDVYEGAPTTITGFMSTGGKAAAFSAFLLIFAPGLLEQLGSLRHVLALLAALTMIVGNVIAIAQLSIKRMLAYSSVAHAGYILTGVIAANSYGQNGILYYLLAYTLMNVGAFGVLALLENADGTNVTFDDYAGLSKRQPLLAGLMALFMFSLSGIPPFAGFFGKYYVFAGAIGAGYTWLAIVGVLMSAVSAYYYLRVVVVMYFSDGTGRSEPRFSPIGAAALIVSALAVVVLGLFPSSVLHVTMRLF